MLGLGQRAAIVSGVTAALVACAGGSPPSTAPAPAAGKVAATALTRVGAVTPAPPLPPIPHVTGPVAITVVYPRPEALIESRDSNFILGSIGTGDATLTMGKDKNLGPELKKALATYDKRSAFDQDAVAPRYTKIKY